MRLREHNYMRTPLTLIFCFQSSPTGSSSSIAEAVRLLSDLLSRQGINFGDGYVTDQAEAAPLAAILEVKVNN